ncbi:MAG TPA: heme A synthase [Nitrolancea sp.]|nr:heme A synthase [Nitrolancea sp.]
MRQRGDSMRVLVRRISVAATVGMFIVLIMGATVTNTGSEMGCGRSWPLCHGEFIPQFAVATLIEYSHRFVTSIEAVLVVAASVGALAYWRHRREIRILVPMMLFFLFLQAGLGAWAVLYPQTTAVLALHFGVSLTSFASVLLTTVFLYEVDGSDALRDKPLSANFRWLVWGTILYTYVLVYLGAYVRHANASMACMGWPLCNGSILPEMTGPIAVVFVHRLAALAGVLLIAGLLVRTYRTRVERPDLYKGSIAAMFFIILQVFSGGVVVMTQLGLFSTLTHAGLATLLFGSLSYLCMHTLPRPAAQAARQPGTLRPGSAESFDVGLPSGQ